MGDEAAYRRSKVIWLAAIVSVAIFLLGVRAFLDPVAASGGFGLPMHTGSETAFVQVYGTRNALLGAIAVGLIARRMMRPTALLFTLATLLPPLDAWVIGSRVGVGMVLVRHAVIFLVLVTTSTLLWRLDARIGTRRAP